MRRARRALEAAGVRAGDRVCAVVGNTPETIVAALGAASIGAVWSSCSPDFGVQGIVDRFGQIEPSVLVAIDSYVYGGKRFDCTAKIRALAVALPTVTEAPATTAPPASRTTPATVAVAVVVGPPGSLPPQAATRTDTISAMASLGSDLGICMSA